MKTPFGDIIVLVDDTEYNFYIETMHIANKKVCPDLTDCYRIAVNFEPDGDNHEIKCIIANLEFSSKNIESGEDYECISFYDNYGNKISIGAEGECIDTQIKYLENGIAYLLKKDAFDNRYKFGIAWIDGVTDSPERDVQTWFGADISLD